MGSQVRKSLGCFPFLVTVDEQIGDIVGGGYWDPVSDEGPLSI